MIWKCLLEISLILIFRFDAGILEHIEQAGVWCACSQMYFKEAVCTFIIENYRHKEQTIITNNKVKRDNNFLNLIKIICYIIYSYSHIMTLP